MSSKPYVRVAVGVILRADGAVLLGSRPTDKPWAYWWELPGGKIEPNEQVTEALIRELQEEIAITATQVTPWVRYVHHYPKSTVELHFCQVTAWEGEPNPQENQRLAWYHPHQPTPLAIGPILPATFPVLKWLSLPDRYALSQLGDPADLNHWLERLEHALQQGLRLVQFREPAWENAHPNSPALFQALKQTVALCQRYQARCLLNSVHPLEWLPECDGLHVRSHDATLLPPNLRTQLDSSQLLAMSVHSGADLQLAQRLQTDFVVLGHVLDTPSHPDQPALGWHAFSELAAQAGRPVYAIGGQSLSTLAQAQQHGAHGIAGIRQLL